MSIEPKAEARRGIDRRGVLKIVLLISAMPFVVFQSSRAEGQKGASTAAEKWMDEWMGQPPSYSKKKVREVPHMGRFKDPMYFLVREIAWEPNAEQIGRLPAIVVPVGFVTDFASIPCCFWSLLRPDGDYTFAAIVHDYLYWTQALSRLESDEIFDVAMQDLDIGGFARFAIYWSVRLAGWMVWNGNSKAKAGGDKRLLKVFPDNPTITWQTWQTDSSRFAD